MKKKWEDPAKHPPKPETMNTPGDFRRFTDLMRKLVSVPRSDVVRRIETGKRGKELRQTRIMPKPLGSRE
jgi:hypothetical protein